VANPDDAVKTAQLHIPPGDLAPLKKLDSAQLQKISAIVSHHHTTAADGTSTFVYAVVLAVVIAVLIT